jgi:hypothetical protein
MVKYRRCILLWKDKRNKKGEGTSVTLAPEKEYKEINPNPSASVPIQAQASRLCFPYTT